MPDAVDTGIALFISVFAVGFLVVAAISMILFYRERNAFEIKARSAYLVVLIGISFMAVILQISANQVELLFEYDTTNVYLAKTVKYFVVVCCTCCYGSRTIRLALLYLPKARKAAPWLLPERNHVVACIVLGLAAMSVPLFEMALASEDPEAEKDFADVGERRLWIVSVTCQAVVLALNPLAWMVDDIFNLGRELRIMAVVQCLEILGGALPCDEGTEAGRLLDEEKLLFLKSVIMFSVSVIHPTRQRLFHPMQCSDPKLVATLERRKSAGVTMTCSPALVFRDRSRDRGRSHTSASFASAISARRFSWGRRDSDASCTGDDEYDDDDGENSGIEGGLVPATVDTSSAVGASPSDSPESWTYERVMSMPAVAAAFEEYSRKALCQESFLFLKDVAAYQHQDFTDEESKHNDRRGKGGGANGTERGRTAQEAQFFACAHIVREYIAEGAPNEINISSRDKKGIFDVYNSGELGFLTLPTKTKRLVFARAYSEIRFLLERNLMIKFISTERFKTSLAEDRKGGKYFPH